MKPMYERWHMQIDITNKCFLSCLYCSRYMRHIPEEKIYFMDLEYFENILKSLEGWPQRIGIIGGEPTMHPQFPEICQIIRKYFPKAIMGLWTSGHKNFKKYWSEIDQTFQLIAYNEHNAEQRKKCKHQPLTLAIDEMLDDKALVRELIDDCWCGNGWCATVNQYGGYFCEVGAALDVLLYDGAHAYKIEPGWWKRGVAQFEDQIQPLCFKCGMALPINRETLSTPQEKFTPKLLEEFRAKHLPFTADQDVILVEKKLTNEDVYENAKTWYPANYRNDDRPDGIGEPPGSTIYGPGGTKFKK